MPPFNTDLVSRDGAREGHPKGGKFWYSPSADPPPLDQEVGCPVIGGIMNQSLPYPETNPAPTPITLNNKHLPSNYHMPGTSPRVLHLLTHLNPITTL